MPAKKRQRLTSSQQEDIDKIVPEIQEVFQEILKYVPDEKKGKS